MPKFNLDHVRPDLKTVCDLINQARQLFAKAECLHMYTDRECNQFYDKAQDLRFAAMLKCPSTDLFNSLWAVSE